MPTALLASGALRRSAATRSWAGSSVGCCLAAGLLALRFPEAPRDGGRRGRRGHAARRASPPRCAVRACCCVVLAVALIGGLDAVEEYFPVLAADRGVPVTAVPLASWSSRWPVRPARRSVAGPAGCPTGRCRRCSWWPGLLLGVGGRLPGRVARGRGAVLRALPRGAGGRRGAAAGPDHRPLPRDPHLGGGRGHRDWRRCWCSAAWAVGGAVAVAVARAGRRPPGGRRAAEPDVAHAGRTAARARARYADGVMPTTARKSRLKCAWSNQPSEAARPARSSTVAGVDRRGGVLQPVPRQHRLGAHADVGGEQPLQRADAHGPRARPPGPPGPGTRSSVMRAEQPEQVEVGGRRVGRERGEGGVEHGGAVVVVLGGQDAVQQCVRGRPRARARAA